MYVCFKFLFNLQSTCFFFFSLPFALPFILFFVVLYSFLFRFTFNFVMVLHEFMHILKTKSNFTLLLYIPFLGIGEWYFKCD